MTSEDVSNDSVANRTYENRREYTATDENGQREDVSRFCGNGYIFMRFNLHLETPAMSTWLQDESDECYETAMMIPITVAPIKNVTMPATG